MSLDSPFASCISDDNSEMKKFPALNSTWNMKLHLSNVALFIHNKIK